jgi:hypothetical protein
MTKQARNTNHVGRFINTLRQRISRLARDTLSCSKKLANHVGAIKFFIGHYNLAKAAALPVQHYPNRALGKPLYKLTMPYALTVMVRVIFFMFARLRSVPK